ncbi:MAG: tryptophan--tRNA ligase [Promethearchaeota archaeon]
MAKEFVVTPWEISGEIDYNRIVEDFGLQLIDDDIIEQIRAQTKEIHPFLRRRIFFSHRDFDWILKMYRDGNEFFLYTGRGPSGQVHLGHLLPWIFTKWLQEKFDVELWFQMTDDEKFLFKPSLTLEQTSELAYENALDVIALGFKKENTHIFLDTELANSIYRLAIKIAKRLTFSTIKATFGLTDSDNVGKIFFTCIQAVPAILKSEIEGRNVPCLIPQAVDQDPHFRIARDIIPKLGFYKPALIHSIFLPSLQQSGKMSSSTGGSAIFTSDPPDVVKKKVWSAFTGGRKSLAEQKKLGGNPNICSVYKYFFSFFMLDDNEVRDIKAKCMNGELICGDCKKLLTEKINKFLKEHQEKREKAKDLIDKYILSEKFDLKETIAEKCK